MNKKRILLSAALGTYLVIRGGLGISSYLDARPPLQQIPPYSKAFAAAVSKLETALYDPRSWVDESGGAIPPIREQGIELVSTSRIDGGFGEKNGRLTIYLDFRPSLWKTLRSWFLADTKGLTIPVFVTGYRDTTDSLSVLAIYPVPEKFTEKTFQSLVINLYGQETVTRQSPGEAFYNLLAMVVGARTRIVTGYSAHTEKGSYLLVLLDRNGQKAVTLSGPMKDKRTSWDSKDLLPEGQKLANALEQLLSQ